MKLLRNSSISIVVWETEETRVTKWRIALISYIRALYYFLQAWGIQASALVQNDVFLIMSIELGN